MLTNKDILDEKNKILRKTSKEVTFPLSKDDRDKINLMIEYLRNSQIEKIAKKYNLRPGMGLSAVQLGILKRYFVVVHEQEVKETFKTYVIINPKITSNSQEIIYVDEGEGCLSVNRDVEGIVKRYARCTVEGFDMDGNPIKIRAREELSVAFRHEIDHLNGILFYDKIDKNDPFKDADLYRSI